MLSASDYLSIVECGTGEPTEIGIQVLLSGNVSLTDVVDLEPLGVGYHGSKLGLSDIPGHSV